MYLEVAFLPLGSDRHHVITCAFPRLHMSVPCCSVVVGLKRTVTENPEALGVFKSFLSEAGYTWR